MAEFSKTWWGNKFIAAIASFTDEARLARGRSYARGGKILEFSANKGKIEAIVRGSVNPYFGVYKEPRYHTEIELKAIAKKDWSKILQKLSANASFVSKLLLNEVPENIEDSFREVNKRFLPHDSRDMETHCDCPDWSNPCKHIAGLCYRFAAELDEDPFLLFELRGLTREELKQELIKTPLGKALAAGLGSEKLAPVPVSAYYTQPETVDAEAIALKEFWLGRKHFPDVSPRGRENGIPAILIKKQGDFPPFWHEDRSFIEVMEELYERVKTKNKDVF
ncbi:MAG: SWIM zinc finger family protein [Spirulina sp.]